MKRIIALLTLCLCILAVSASPSQATPFTLLDQRYQVDGYLSPGFVDDIILPAQDSAAPVSSFHDYGGSYERMVYATGNIDASSIYLESGVEDANYIGLGRSQATFQTNADVIADVFLLGERTGGDAFWTLSLYDMTTDELLISHDPSMAEFEEESEYYLRSFEFQFYDSHTYLLDVTAFGYHLDLSNIQTVISFPTMSVPEPATVSLFGVVLAFLFMFRGRSSIGRARN